MDLGPELRWSVAAILLALAAAVSYLGMRRPILFILALLLTPLPAFLFIRLTSTIYDDTPPEDLLLGIVFSALACYLSTWLGVLTAYVAVIVRKSDQTGTRG